MVRDYIAETLMTSDSEVPTVYTYRNKFSQKLFINSLILQPDVYYARYGHLTIKINGIINKIYPANDTDSLGKFKLYSIDEKWELSPHDEISFEIFTTESLTGRDEIRLGINMDVNYEDAFAPLTRTRFDPLEFLGVSITKQLLPVKVYNDTGNQDIITQLLDVEQYPNLKIIINAKSVYRPELISNTIHSHTDDLINLMKTAQLGSRTLDDSAPIDTIKSSIVAENTGSAFYYYNRRYYTGSLLFSLLPITLRLPNGNLLVPENRPTETIDTNLAIYDLPVDGVNRNFSFDMLCTNNIDAVFFFYYFAGVLLSGEQQTLGHGLQITSQLYQVYNFIKKGIEVKTITAHTLFIEASDDDFVDDIVVLATINDYDNAQATYTFQTNRRQVRFRRQTALSYAQIRKQENEKIRDLASSVSLSRVNRNGRTPLNTPYVTRDLRRAGDQNRKDFVAWFNAINPTAVQSIFGNIPWQNLAMAPTPFADFAKIWWHREEIKSQDKGTFTFVSSNVEGISENFSAKFKLQIQDNEGDWIDLTAYSEFTVTTHGNHIKEISEFSEQIKQKVPSGQSIVRAVMEVSGTVELSASVILS